MSFLYSKEIKRNVKKHRFSPAQQSSDRGKSRNFLDYRCNNLDFLPRTTLSCFEEGNIDGETKGNTLSRLWCVRISTLALLPLNNTVTLRCPGC